MTIRIEANPPAPQGLKEASLSGRLVPFIGAGVSRLAGCPNWVEFASRAIDSLVEQKALTPLQRSQLTHLSPRLKLSLAELTAKEKRVQVDYRSILQNDRWKEHKEGRRIYRSIASLGTRFVTTNYDEWLDIVLPAAETPASSKAEEERPDDRRVSLFAPEQITADKFASPNCVVHLHGSIADPASMILSTTDYIRHYAADRNRDGGRGENKILSFLNFLFDRKTVLFLGYGLEELEILEYILLKSRNDGRPSRETKHYLLQGFYSVESEFCEALQKYYLDCGIELIPFLKDENDWGQLTNVLEGFAKSLPANQELMVQDFREMEGLIDD